MNTKSSKRLNGIDVVKFIMAFAVVTIHTQALFNCKYPASINWFIRLAVPYFFIVSGFLTARSLTLLDSSTDKFNYLKNRALRFGKMFLLWLLIYLPISLINFNYEDSSVIAKEILHYAISVILNGESKLAWPLWYLYSSMIAYFLLYVLGRYRWGKILTLLLAVLVIASTLVIPSLILPKYVFFFAKGIFERILGGLPYILTGLLLYKYRHKPTNVIFALSILILSYILFYFDISIFTLLGGASMFLISYIITLPDKSIYNNLNIIGIWIYLTHMFNLMVIKVLLKITNTSIDRFTLLIISFLFTFITSSMLYQLSKTKRFKWLKKLI